MKYGYEIKLGSFENETTYILLHNDQMTQYELENKLILAITPALRLKLSNEFINAKRVLVDFNETVVPSVSLSDLDINMILDGLYQLGFELFSSECSLKILDTKFTPADENVETADAFYVEKNLKSISRTINVMETVSKEQIITDELLQTAKPLWLSWVNTKTKYLESIAVVE